MLYLTVKHLHMTLALISIIGFILRGALALRQHPFLQRKWVRIVPHINDTLLLTAAIWLAWTLRLHPLNSGWIAAKVIALVVYIGLGTMVIKGKGSLLVQWICYIAGILTFVYIAAVAMTKTVWPFF